MEANVAMAVATATRLPSPFSLHSLASSTEFAITSWYSASLANNYATPSLLDILGSPLTLNMLEQLCMAAVALVALPANRVRFLPTAATLMKAGGFAPILAMGLAK